MYIDLNGTTAPTYMEVRFIDSSANEAKATIEVESSSQVLETGYHSFEMATGGLALDGGMDLTDIVTMRINILGAKNGLKIYIDSLQIVENDSTPRFILTFDNGYDEHFDVVRPLLNARDMKAHFYVNKSTIDTAGYMTTAQLLTLQSEGHMVGNHSATHANWETGPLMFYEMVDEMLEGRRWLKSIGINEGRFFYAHPGGSAVTVPADGSANVAFWKFLQEYNYHVRLTAGIGDGPRGGLVENVNIQFGLPNRSGYRSMSPASSVAIFDTGSPASGEVSGQTFIDRVVDNNGLGVVFWHEIGSGGDIETDEFTEFLNYLNTEGVEVTTFDKLMEWAPQFEKIKNRYRSRYGSSNSYKKESN
jgi:peptidoglycan/xylan/chitin deacetylase (PgdA/CDA1 family)